MTQSDKKLREYREAFERIQRTMCHTGGLNGAGDWQERIEGRISEMDLHFLMSSFHKLDSTSRHTDKLLEMAAEGLERIKLSCETASGWEDGETFYKSAVESNLETASETLLTLQQHGFGKE